MNQKVLLVSHDGGGAEIIAAWYQQHHSKCDISCLLAGPARKIFMRELKSFKEVSLDYIQCLNPGDFVLTGSSLESDLERKAISEAKKNQAYCITFLDHWDLYKERFEHVPGSGINYPDEIWVGDQYAYDYALSQGIPKKKIKQVENPYAAPFREICEKRNGLEGGMKILYICEPVSRKLKEVYGSECINYDDELTIIHHLAKTLKDRKNPRVSLTLRLHPSEEKKKYRKFEKYNEFYQFRFSDNPKLADDFRDHSIIVGIESNALVLGIYAGKKVYSCITGKQWKISLPHEEIKRISNFNQLFS
jgi:hypothetical protein